MDLDTSPSSRAMMPGSYYARLEWPSIFIVSECPPSCHKQRLEGNQERELRKGKRRAVFVSAGRLRP